jgi:hypothetical protein
VIEAEPVDRPVNAIKIAVLHERLDRLLQCVRIVARRNLPYAIEILDRRVSSLSFPASILVSRNGGHLSSWNSPDLMAG